MLRYVYEMYQVSNTVKFVQDRGPREVRGVRGDSSEQNRDFSSQDLSARSGGRKQQQEPDRFGCCWQYRRLQRSCSKHRYRHLHRHWPGTKLRDVVWVE